MQLRFIFAKILILFISIFAVAISERHYTVIAPGTLKSNRNYTVCVTLHTPGESAIIRVALIGEPLFYLEKNIELQPLESKLIDFMPPKLDETHTVKLLVEGVKGIQFQNSTNLLVNDVDALNVYIQTDKGVYKPGDMVQFRVLILDEHLRPFVAVEPIKVEVMDGKYNRIKQFKDIQLNTGVFSSKFQLSEHPVMGHWVIIVTISGKYDFSRGKQFLVERYVLPKFSVHIAGDLDCVVGSPIITIEVYGKYTYGRYVEGSATVQLIHPYTNRTISSQEKPIQNYRSIFTMDLTQIEHLAQFTWIGVAATVTEKQTGLKQMTMQHLNIRQNKYEIIVPDEDIEFKNNIPYKMNAFVQHWNGSLVIDRKTPIIMEHGNRTYQAFQNAKGVATFTFQYEEKDISIFSYATSKTVITNIFIKNNLRFDESLTRCTLKIKEGKFKFGTTIDIELSSRFDIPYIVYTITSHASIVRLKSIRLPPYQKTYTVSIKPAIDMLPRSYIYVHYIELGELRYCELKLSFPYVFENQVDIYAPSEALPGEKVNLTLKAEPNSFVGLLAVDLSVHLLNSKYNLNKMEIFTDLLYDQTYTNIALIYPGQQSGLLTLTNAHYVYVTPKDTSAKTRGSNPLNPSNPQDSFTIRSKFPDTWIFMDLNVTKADTTLNLNVPDSITTWLITAFSINPITGFGMMTYPSNLTVFKPFFISTNLPYAIRRGEIVKITFTIFNYHLRDLDTIVTMKMNDEAFDFINEPIEKPENIQNLKRIKVPANGGRSDYFTIKAKQLGTIAVHLEATSEMFRDGLIQNLKVEPEGHIKHHTENVYVDLPGTAQRYRKTFVIDIPSNAITKSEFVQLSIGGSALASVLDNLEQLVQLPTGCGEQNMINLAPNILVVDYLKSLSKTSENTKLMEKAMAFIHQGYQQELSYRHESGGFSVFGPEEKTAESTWLTAYVVRFFIKSFHYAEIETRIIESGLKYLSEKQLPEGDFVLTGYLFYPAHQNRYGFTAFVLMTFLESPKYARKYKTLIRRSVDFLTQNLNSIDDTYALAIVTAALQMANNEHAQEFVNKLMTKGLEDNGYKWWTSSGNEHTNEVEITAYVLIASLDLLPDGDHVPIYRWLVKQRNKAGGFQSTHDTVLGLQALIKYSQRYRTTNGTMLKVDYAATDIDGGDIGKGVFGIDPSNILISQQRELPQTTRSLDISIEGHGSAVLQLSYHYYISDSPVSIVQEHNAIITTRGAEARTKAITLAASGTFPQDNEPADSTHQHPEELKSFQITTLAKMTTFDTLQMEICFEFKPSDILKYRKSNMVIMEVTLPSGFIADAEVMMQLRKEDFIAKAELKNQDTLIMIYMENLKADSDEECLSLKADMVHKVQMLKATPIVMYDYYNLNYRDTVMYEIQN